MPELKDLKTTFLNSTSQHIDVFFDGGLEGLRPMLRQHK